LFAFRTTVNCSASYPAALVVLPLCFQSGGMAEIVYHIGRARQLAVVSGTTETAVTEVRDGLHNDLRELSP
jgi:hypothetical protein